MILVGGNMPPLLRMAGMRYAWLVGRKRGLGVSKVSVVATLHTLPVWRFRPRHTLISKIKPFSLATSKLLRFRPFSTSDDSDLQLDHIRLSTASLGLAPDVIEPGFAAIQQLPEVDSSLRSTDQGSASAIENLKRAVQVFEMMSKGGVEHRAVLGLLAQYQQSAGRYTDASETLDTLRGFVTEPTNVSLAQAKALWYGGDYSKSFQKCQKIADEDFCPALRQACALNGMGVSSLLLVPANDFQEMDAIRELLRVAAKTVQNAYQEKPMSPELGLASTACYGNLGVAEFVYSDFLSCKVPDMPVPKDTALQAWRDGLNLLEHVESFPKLSPRHMKLTDLMRARLHANMAWVLLDSDDDNEEFLSIASEYARLSLSIYEKNYGLSEGELRASLGRALSLVARCYVKAESAVTAEGLFQTAVESLSDSVSPLEKLDLRYTFEGYACLCRNWDKRQGDATRLEKQGEEVDGSLIENWKGKAGIYSGIWFFTPGDFY